MRYLIFEPSISGHHLEYISHLLSYSVSCKSNDEFYFILNERFENTLISKYKLNDNIFIEYISDRYTLIVNNAKRKLIRSFKLSKCLKFYNKKIHPDKIILAWMPPLLPLLPLFIYRKEIFRGIVFNAPKLKRETFYKKFINTVLYKYIYKSKIFDRIWFVNNKDIVKILNNKYNTNVYHSLPDPINIVDSLNESIIKEYHNKEKTILFHGGSMTKSKGTIDFIDALKLIPQSLHKKFIVIFVGKFSNPDDKQYLIDFINSQSLYEIIYKDEFISYEDLCSYISISDYVILPYKRTEQSSGLLGYSALYNVPVIGPGYGLLGQLIRDNDLGLTLTDTSPEYLSKVLAGLSKSKKNKNNNKSEQYVSDNSIKEFVNSIFS